MGKLGITKETIFNLDFNAKTRDLDILKLINLDLDIQDRDTHDALNCLRWDTLLLQPYRISQFNFVGT